jgi:hypothetical protein
VNKQRDEKLEKQAKELSVRTFFFWIAEIFDRLLLFLQKDRRDSLMDVHQRKRKTEVEVKLGENDVFFYQKSFY